MSRKRIVAGNWKMNLDFNAAMNLTRALTHEVSSSPVVEVIICPSYLYLYPILHLLSEEGSNITVAAQDCHSGSYGAYTGDVSAAMLVSIGVKQVIIGHSERRAYHHEDGSLLSGKINQALSAGLKVIYCVGEQLSERLAGHAETIVATQLSEGLANVDSAQMNKLVLAYEPVWAIGTGQTATTQQAQDMHHFIRGVIQSNFDASCAQQLPILYGGSVKADNALSLFSMPDVDGGLVGGASLDVHSFVPIIKAAQSAH